ncbi:MAG: TIGR02099 family protein [Betaproteobacteria bacterium]|nr:TIGR02099 family protein [Betaproteobacteria bacterium]
MKRARRAMEIAACAVVFLVAAVVLPLRYWILPHIESYRQDIVDAVSRRIGLPVRIASLEAGWRGLRPEIRLFEVRVYDEQGREALVLPSVDNVLAWRSLLYGELRLHSLAIEGPRLSVRRDPEGVLYVAGLRIGGGRADGRMSDWILGQDDIVVSDAEIEWRDEKRGAPPLLLSSVNLRLRNSGDAHYLGLSARTPQELGSTLELRVESAGRSLARLEAWSGRAFMEVGYTSLAGWRPWIDYPLDVRKGEGALRLWATLENGALARATADVALSGVVAQLGSELPPIELAGVSGRLQGALREGGYDLSGRHLALVSARGSGIEPTDFDFSWRPASAASGSSAPAPERGLIASRDVELEPLARLAGTLPLPEEARKLIADIAPRGRVTDARLEWTGRFAEPATLHGQGRFADLAMRPWRQVPGFAGLSGSVDADERHGSVHLDSQRAEIDVPRVLTEPHVRLQALSGDIQFERPSAAPGTLNVRLASLAFANEHLEGKASGSYSWTGEGSGNIDLEATLKRADGEQLVRYLPLAEVMGASVHDYIARAIVGGRASDVRLRMQGNLRDFPFADPAKGDFRVSAKVEKGVLEYVPGWPRIYDVDAEILFERQKMEIVGRSASVLGARLANVRVGIADLAARPAVLTVAGQAEGPTAEFLAFVDNSPVHTMIGGFTDTVRAEGRGKLRLALEVPLADPQATKIDGEYELVSNTVVAHGGLPPIERATGRISFTQSTLTFRDVKGRFLGGPVVISGGSRPGAGVDVQARGDATIAGAQALLDHPLRRYLAGAAPYSAGVTVRDGRTRVSFESSLRGVTSALPAPFSKSAADALPIRVDVFPAEGGARDRVAVSVARIASAELLRRRQGEVMTVQRAALWLSPVADQPARLPERPGLLIYGSLGALDLDRWLAVLAAEAPKGTEASRSAPPPAQAAATAAAQAQGVADGPVSYDVKIGTLDAFGKRLHAVVLRAGSDGSGWSATIDAEEMAGEVSYRGEKGGALVARLTHFRIPDSYPGANPDDEPSHAKELPAVDLVAERFTMRDKQLGRIEVLANRAESGWRIEKLALINTEASVSGRGLWRPAEGKSGVPQTSLQLNLESSDGGKLLERLGYAGLVRGTTAKMQASIGWAGDPVAIDYPTLSGTVQLQAEDGQFLEIEPGIGKLVSLMSLQALPRRLTLDFRDVFSKGFQFDRIAAAANISRGVMTIKDFKMTGSAADVDMSGEVDLSQETQNLHVRVLPQLGDTASTALVLINPLLFFPATIAQKILKDPLGHIFAFNYQVTGTWSDPKVTKGRVEAEEVAPDKAPEAKPAPEGKPSPEGKPAPKVSE